MPETTAPDYSLANPETLTKYKTAATISHTVLNSVIGWCVAGEKIVEICQRGDKLLEEEIAKVYKGKKILKGFSHPTTVSPSSHITPYTPLTTETADALVELSKGEVVKIQLGAQIDGFGTIACDTIVVPAEAGKHEAVTGREADLLAATHWCNELQLRLMLPPGLLHEGSEEEKKKAQAVKPPTQTKITQLLEKVAKTYGCSLVENTTSWLFEHNEIEGKKKIVLAPTEGQRGDGIPELGEVWGVETGLSLGSGKNKVLENRPTLHRRTTITCGLKRPSSRQILSEVVKKFGQFPFSIRQLEDERAGKIGLVECVRSNVVRQYEVVADKDGEPVSRLFTTIAITKNGIQRLAGPNTPELSNFKTDKKITDEEILKILEQPLSKTIAPKPKNKNKKKKKKPTKKAEAESESEESDSE